MMNTEKLCALIEQKQDRLFELLGDLIRINSENFSSYGNEKECPAYIAELCRKLGLETDFYSPMDLENFENHPDFFPGRHLEDRYNVTARWAGKEDTDALMLMGHHDTVVIGNPENWSFDPLSGEVRDGNIWGRGACDDKYALATVLFLIELLQAEGYTPGKNLLFTAYCDEEKGGSHGALAAALRYPCDRIVNMDCKNFEIWHCASGGQDAAYRFHTAETVDSAKLTAQAVPVVMEVIEEFGARRRKELEENRFYKGTTIPETALRYMGIRAGDRGADLGVGEVMFCVYSDKTKEEIFEEYREMEAVLTERLAPLGIIGDGFVSCCRFFHYGYREPDCAGIVALQQAAKEATGRDLVPCGSCLSDLSVLMKYGGADVFAFGAGRDFGVYGGAHQADEFIECDRLVEYTKIIGAYMLKTLE